MKEKDGYRLLLADILDYTGGRHLLTVADVKGFTGFKDNRTVKKKYTFKDGYIAASELARMML